MEERVRAASGSLLLIGSGVVNALIAFLTLVFLTRHLSKEDYGLWTFALSTALFLYLFTTLGVDRLVGYFLPRYRERDPARALTVFRLGSFVKVLLTALTIAGTLVLGALMHPVFFWVALLLACLAPQVYLLTILDSLQAFRLSAGLTVVESLLRLGLIVLFTGLPQKDLGTLTLLYGIPYLLSAALALFHVRLPRTERPISLSELRDEALLYWRWFLLYEVFQPMALYGQQLLLGYFRQLTDLADYGVAASLSAALTVVAKSIHGSLTPTFLKKFDNESLRQSLAEATRYAQLVSVFLFVFIYFNASVLVLRFFSDKYAGAALNLQVLALGHLTIMALAAVTPTAYALGRPDLRAKATAVNAVLSLVAGWLLIPHYGSMGASAAFTLGFVAAAIANAWSVHRLLPIAFPYASLARGCVAALASFLLLQWAAQWAVLPPIPHLFFQLSGGLLLYLLLLWLMRELQPQDREVIVASLKALVRRERSGAPESEDARMP